jgi:hypothetical protein
MATVTAEYRYADGDVVTVMVDVENDALAEAKATAVQGVKDLTGIGSAEVQVEEPTD